MSHNTHLTPPSSQPPAGKKLTVAVVGGSISAGTGAYDVLTDAWVDRLEVWLREVYGHNHGIKVTVNNGAVPGEGQALLSLLRPKQLHLCALV